jgi:hypothetical protein
MRRIIALIKYNLFLARKYLKDNRKSIIKQLLRLLKYLVLLFLGALLYDFQREHLISNADWKDILSVLISTVGIISAIIITFLFSKLYSERNERIQRKIQIDGFSKKLTALRRIAHFLRSSHEFWRFNKTKQHLDNKYKNLTLAKFMRMDYDKSTALIDEIEGSELTVLAYLSLKELEKPAPSSFSFYSPVWLVNYGLNDLARYQDACRRIWSFFDEFKDRVNASLISRFEQINLIDNLKLVYPETSQFEITNSIFYNLFNDFPEKFIREHYYLTRLNSKPLGVSLTGLLINLTLLIVILAGGVVLLSIQMNEYYSIMLLNVIVSLFIISVIDMTINIILSIKKELTIDEHYQV